MEKSAKYGFSTTTLAPATLNFIQAMEKTGFSLVRPKVPGLKGAKAKQSSRKYVCPGCGAIIRATNSAPDTHKAFCKRCFERYNHGIFPMTGKAFKAPGCAV